MRHLLGLVAIFISTSAVAAQGAQLSAVQQLQWQNRVLIIWSNQAQAEFDGFIEAYQVAIDDRDMVLFVIDRDRRVFSNYSGNIDNHLVTSLISNFPQQIGNYFLLGKDGEIKSYGNKLDIEQIFAEINLMPMRRQEMHNRSQD